MSEISIVGHRYASEVAREQEYQQHMKRTFTMVESLESRHLLSAAMTLHHCMLAVSGTKGNDVILLSADDDHVNVEHNGVSESFARSKVKFVLVNGGKGDDHIEALSDAGPVDYESNPDGGAAGGVFDIPVVFLGDKGADVLIGGEAGDLLLGGHGDDFMFGNAGNDIMLGDHGNDVMAGGDGNDLMFGGHGDDTMGGGLGDDILHGNHGVDDLFGEGGVDTLID